LTRDSLWRFAQQVALALALTGASVAAWILRDVLLIFFGGLVLAIGIGAVAKTLSDRLHIGYIAGLSFAIFAGFVLIAAVGWFFGAAIGQQFDEVTRKVPAGLRWLTDEIDARPYARDLLAKLQMADFVGSTGWIATALAAAAQSSVVAIASLIAMAIISI
jgi:predicted PurR-regulated permease PerM